MDDEMSDTMSDPTVATMPPPERKAPRQPPETSKNTGWWAAMIVISRDGAASELDRVFQVADRPNPNYRLQVHEGLREVRRRRGGARGGGARGGGGAAGQHEVAVWSEDVDLEVLGAWG